MATFVGNANILTGIVESIAEEEIDGTSAQITVRTDAGKVKVSMDTAAASDRGYFPQKGEKVTIAVRSENIRFEENEKKCTTKHAELHIRKHTKECTGARSKKTQMTAAMA